MERKVMVAFNTVDEVAAFVKDMSRFPEEVHIDLVSGRHVVSAASLLGILSLDLSKPVEVTTKVSPISYSPIDSGLTQIILTLSPTFAFLSIIISPFIC